MITYDIITVGGGIGGAVLARSLAEQGYRVLILERELQFKDRVRGEFVFPWGVAEAKQLGVYETLIQAGGHHPKFWTDYFGPDQLPPRDFETDTPQKVRGLCMYHPQMQETLLQAAEASGAEVRRGTRVSGVESGNKPKVMFDENGTQSVVSARFIIGADGRSSGMRKWGAFKTREDPRGNIFAGVLLDNVPASMDSSICMLNPFQTRTVSYFPQTESSGRAYLASPSKGGVRFSGNGDFELFLEECRRSGLADGILNGARQAGPLATFEGADTWVEHPYKNGIALIGDAAATSDPTWGQGLSLTLHDARILRDMLLSTGNWDAAGNAYAAAHDDYYARIKTTLSWFTHVFLQPGPDAEKLRERVLPQLETDPFFLPDTLIAGPDMAPPTEEHRLKLFGQRSLIE